MAKKNKKVTASSPMLDQIVAGAEAGLDFIKSEEKPTMEQVKAIAALEIIAAADMEADVEKGEQLSLITPAPAEAALELPATPPKVEKPSVIEQLGKGSEIISTATTKAAIASYNGFVTFCKAIWGILGIVGMFTVVAYAFTWYGVGRIVRFHVRSVKHGLAGFDFGKLPNAETV